MRKESSIVDSLATKSHQSLLLFQNHVYIDLGVLCTSSHVYLKWSLYDKLVLHITHCDEVVHFVISSFFVPFLLTKTSVTTIPKKLDCKSCKRYNTITKLSSLGDFSVVSRIFSHFCTFMTLC